MVRRGDKKGEEGSRNKIKEESGKGIHSTHCYTKLINIVIM